MGRLTLDEIEALANEVHARNASVKFGDPRYTCSIGSNELLRLLIAIKAVLPVVRAAEAQVDNWRDTKAEDISGQRLEDAVDEMRRALDGGKP